MAPTYIETRGVTLDIAVFTDEPGATTGVEDFRPGDEVDWSFYCLNLLTVRIFRDTDG
jgi:hypothetical protein